MRFATCFIMVMATGLMAGCAGTTGTGGASNCPMPSDADLAKAVQATNAVRARHGLSPVTGNKTLSKAAAGHACDMAARGQMVHHGSTTSGPAQRVKALGYRPTITAENIAYGPYDTDRVLTEWSHSSGHLHNILIPQMREVGIGSAPDQTGKWRYWAAVYANPR